jgi:hypothetical protein
MKYRSIVIATAQTVGLFMSGLFIPLFAWMVTPVPLILAYVRNSRLDGLTALGLSSVIIALLSGWYVAVFILLILGLMAVGVSEGLLRQRKPEFSILLGALPPVAVIGSVTVYFFVQTGRNPVAVIETYIQGQRSEAVKLYGSLGFNDVVNAITAIPDSSIHFFVLMLPCIVALTLISIAACSYATARAFLVRKPGSGPRPVPVAFGLWHAPDTWVWGLIAALTPFVISSETAKIVGWNLVIPFAALYLIQGIALVDHFMKEKVRLPPVARIVIHSIILSLPSFLFVIVIGIVDIWADFRKLRGPVQKT